MGEDWKLRRRSRLRIFKNRLSGSIAYYRQNISDMLTKVTLPNSAGIPNGGFSGNNNYMWANVGSMYNQGFEVDLSYKSTSKRYIVGYQREPNDKYE